MNLVDSGSLLKELEGFVRAMDFAKGTRRREKKRASKEQTRLLMMLPDLALKAVRLMLGKVVLWLVEDLAHDYCSRSLQEMRLR
jgi:hypothetical protein